MQRRSGVLLRHELDDVREPLSPLKRGSEIVVLRDLVIAMVEEPAREVWLASSAEAGGGRATSPEVVWAQCASNGLALVSMMAPARSANSGAANSGFW